MPTPIVAGNWKMNTTIAEAVSLASALREPLDAIDRGREGGLPAARVPDGGEGRA